MANLNFKMRLTNTERMRAATSTVWKNYLWSCSQSSVEIYIPAPPVLLPSLFFFFSLSFHISLFTSLFLLQFFLLAFNSPLSVTSTPLAVKYSLIATLLYILHLAYNQPTLIVFLPPSHPLLYSHSPFPSLTLCVLLFVPSTHTH